MLSGHADHKVFQLFVDARTSNRLLGLGTVTWLVRERAVPSEDGVGPGHCGNLCQGLLPQLLAKLSQRLAFAIRERYATGDLLTEHAILGYQVRIASSQLFVNRRGDRSKEFLP